MSCFILPTISSVIRRLFVVFKRPTGPFGTSDVVDKGEVLGGHPDEDSVDALFYFIETYKVIFFYIFLIIYLELPQVSVLCVKWSVQTVGFCNFETLNFEFIVVGCFGALAKVNSAFDDVCFEVNVLQEFVNVFLVLAIRVYIL